MPSSGFPATPPVPACLHSCSRGKTVKKLSDHLRRLEKPAQLLGTEPFLRPASAHQCFHSWLNRCSLCNTLAWIHTSLALLWQLRLGRC